MQVNNDLYIQLLLGLIDNNIININLDGEELSIDKVEAIRNLRKKEPKKERDIYNIIDLDNINYIYNIYLTSKESKENKQKKAKKDDIDDENIVSVDLTDLVCKLKEVFKRFNYTSKWHTTSTSRRLITIINNKSPKIRLNPNQIMYAYMGYLTEMQNSGRPIEYIKGSEVFLTSAVYDYVEKTKMQYENKMKEKYGESWKKLKFKVK